MALLFADGFDPYAAITDMASRWDTVTPGNSDLLLAAASTAFGSGQALALNSSSTGGTYTKAWGSNEATIFFSVRFRVVSVGSAATYAGFQLTDTGTNQMTVRFNGDGSIGLYAGGATGTLLATVPTGVFALASWHSLQGKIVISNTAGSIELRGNGATTDTYSWTNINTRGGTTNAYANGIRLFGASAATAYIEFDDLFLCSGSGATPNSWPGDLRATRQVPATVVQSQFAPSPAALFAQGSSVLGAASFDANTARWAPVTCPTSGTLASLSINLSAAASGHVTMALYDSSGVGGGAGARLAVSAEIVNPASGVNTFVVAAGPTVTKGTVYWVGVLSDVSLSIYGNVGTIDSLPVSYASGFPATAAGMSSSSGGSFNSTGMTVTPSSAALIGDATEDGSATCIASATVGQEDIYTLSPVPSSYTVVAVNYFAMWKKTDAGSRTIAMSVAANGSADTVLVTNSALSNAYSYSQSPLALDPTGAAWTPTTVNAAKVGVAITA